MATSQTDIVNFALGRLGSTERIDNINDSRQLAQDAKAAWAIIVPGELDYPWNFAIRRAKLNAAAKEPIFGYARCFTLPADCLRWLKPVPEDGEGYFEGEEEGGFLHTNEVAPLNVRYISSDLAHDFSRWPPKLAEAIGYKLAEAMCEGVTGNKGLMDRMEAKGIEAIKRARIIDASKSPKFGRSDITVRSTWLGARNHPYYPYGR